jgi:Hemagglutinin repeat/Bacterial EndoU nuclease
LPRAFADVNIDTAQNTSTSTQDQKFKQSGVSVTFSSPAINALSTLQGMADALDAGSSSQDSRTQALAGVSTAFSAYNLVTSLAQASAISINVSVGSSSSSSHSMQTSSVAATSKVQAGGNLKIKATGTAEGSGNISGIGAELSAGNNATLDAANDIDFKAAQNTYTQSSSNKSSSASIGVGFAFGGAQNGMTLNAAASQGRGSSDGTDDSNTLTTVTAGNGLKLSSGRDTKLIGAVASGNSVTADVGGNLDIQSVQDTSSFTSQEQSAGVGVSLCIPPICYGANSVSASFSKGKVNGEFASVATQSGIKAGDGGFNVNVKGNTHLVAAAITSSQSAVDDNKNSFTSATVTQGELQNKDQYDADSLALSASYSTKLGDQSDQKLDEKGITGKNREAVKAPAAGLNQGIGVGHASGSQSSTTGNSISGATITITSGDDKALQGIDRTAVTETNSANALAKQWDGQQLGQDTKLQAQLTQSVGASASKLVGDYAGKQFTELTAQSAAAGDTPQGRALADEAAKWGEGGVYRVGLHTAIGGLTGGVDGALGAGTSAIAAPAIAQAVKGMDLPEPVRQAVIAVGTTAVSAAVGGTTGAATGFNQVANNYLKHEEINRLVAAKKACDGGDAKACGERDALNALDRSRQQALDACTGSNSAACKSLIEAAATDFDGLVMYQQELMNLIKEGKASYSDLKPYLDKARTESKDIGTHLKVYFYLQANNDTKSPAWSAAKMLEGLDANEMASLWGATAAIGLGKKQPGQASAEGVTTGSTQAGTTPATKAGSGNANEPAVAPAAQAQGGAKVAGETTAPPVKTEAQGKPPASEQDTKLPKPADASADSPYNSMGRGYGETKVTDANGNPVPTGTTAQSTLNGMASKNVDKVNAPIDFDHIIGADYKTKADGTLAIKNGDAVPTGGHSLVNGDVRIKPGSETAPDPTGVYEAKVQMPDPNNPGAWLDKPGNTHTMFPKDWTADRIKVEVDAAWNSPTKVVSGDYWSAMTPSGVKVEGWLSPRVTAFPVKKP